jgi:hypothetical protein
MTNLLLLTNKKEDQHMTKDKLLAIIANLIQELLDTGYEEKNLIWMLTQYGMSLKDIKEWYGIPYDEND